MNLSIIACIDLNRATSNNNSLPLCKKHDNFIKKITKYNTVLMGRKTQDLYKKPFPATRNVIFSKNKQYSKFNTNVIYNFENGLNILEFWQKDFFFVGGNTIFKKAFPYCNKLYITELQTVFENPDSFLPVIESKEWKLISEVFHTQDVWNEHDFKFKVYERID